MPDLGDENAKPLRLIGLIFFRLVPEPRFRSAPERRREAGKIWGRRSTHGLFLRWRICLYRLLLNRLRLYRLRRLFRGLSPPCAASTGLFLRRDKLRHDQLHGDRDDGRKGIEIRLLPKQREPLDRVVKRATRDRIGDPVGGAGERYVKCKLFAHVNSLKRNAAVLLDLIKASCGHVYGATGWSRL